MQRMDGCKSTLEVPQCQHVEKSYMILQVKKQTWQDLLPAQAPCAPSLPPSLGPCWVPSGPAGPRSSGAGVYFLLSEFPRQRWQPNQPCLPWQLHSRHSAQARKRLALREETLEPGPRQGPRGKRPLSPGSRDCWPLRIPQPFKPFARSRP